MNKDHAEHALAAADAKLGKHRFMALIAGVILVATFLVGVALERYNNSGAAQVDFSRPGYQAVRSQVKKDTNTKTFPSTGQLDKAAIEDFKKLYNDRYDRVKNTTAFDPKTLSNDTLQLLDSNPADAAAAANPAQ